MYMHEESEIDRNGSVCNIKFAGFIEMADSILFIIFIILRATNLSFSSIVRAWENVHYRVHPETPQWWADYFPQIFSEDHLLSRTLLSQSVGVRVMIRFANKVENLLINKLVFEMA